MGLKTVVKTIRSDRCARAFVWSVWLVMMLGAVFCLAKFGRNIPLAEDWWLVPPLTGNEPNLASWLWAQNNEHRVPLPKLILLLLLKICKGDFRAGMLLNISVLAALALAMIYTARKVRGNLTRFEDAFFPIALLHLGNWGNIYWSWCFTMIIGVVIASIILLLLVRRGTVATPPDDILAGICLVLLPLSGANGLLFVPPLALWFAYDGYRRWRAVRFATGCRWASKILIGAAVISLCLTGLYFVGYERPSWTPPNPGLVPSIKATLQFLALGFGPVSRSSWILSVTAAVAILLPTAWLLIRRALIPANPKSDRGLEILVFFGTTAAFAFAMGWGRAGVIPLYGIWPLHYVLLAVPAFITAFFAWELYGSPKLRAAVQRGLLIGMVVLGPFNTIHGIWSAKWLLDGDKLLMQDLKAGYSLANIAERHRNLLYPHISADSLTNMMLMLHNAGIGPFAKVQESQSQRRSSTPCYSSTHGQRLVVQEIRYHMPDAGQVFLVWGINGWQVVAEELRPSGTEVRRAMHTPMVHEGNTFVAKVHVPAGATVEYGFLITKSRDLTNIVKPIWDGSQNYELIALNDSVVNVESRLALAPDQAPVITCNKPLVTLEVRYHMPEAGEVFLGWGVDGWHTLPAEIRPAGTIVRNGVMLSPMVQEGDTFVAKVRVPSGAKIDYGFQIKDKRGILDILQPLWDGNQDFQMFVSTSGVLDVRSTVSLPNELSNLLDKIQYFLGGASVFLAVWILIYLFLRFLDRKREASSGQRSRHLRFD